MKQVQKTIIDPMRVEAMHAMLGRDGPAPGVGDPLPEFWHWGQFWTIARADMLGRDGHPKMGQMLPETGLPRRMWAGGTVDFLRDLPIGSAVQRVSWADAPVHKAGASGPLAFVAVHHEISGDDGVAIRERQDLVFREDPGPSDRPPTPPAPPGAALLRTSHSLRPVDLFRYSALTFNGHRIHYDIDYCREVEGYTGLVVHGPLMAQFLIDMARRHLGRLRQFSFRARAPVFQHQRFASCLGEIDGRTTVWIENEEGQAAMIAHAT